MAAFTALVLAGSRRGETDSVAMHAGVKHKSLAPAGGVPMLTRVVDSLRQSPSVGRILVCAEDRGLVTTAAPGTDFFPAEGSPSRSVGSALRSVTPPLLVTTSDHALLTPAMVETFCTAASASGADVAAGVAASATIRAAYPDAVRTFWRFRDEAYSGANLFALMSKGAEPAVSFWRRAEDERKRPWRIVRILGVDNLLLYLCRLLTLQQAFARLSRRLKVRIAPIVLPFAEAAIDVDKPTDLDLANSILARRAA
ncbi:MAG: nucleotidyltransferase family protein [Geminicoccaceae bacterium]